VIGTARRLRALGRAHADPNLAAAGDLFEGRALVRQGRMAEGMALLDGAMLAVRSGELRPEYAGNIYCHLMAAFAELADVRRAAEWTEATSRWLAGLPAAVLFTGICRVHRSQVLQRKGAWAQAEREAAQVCQDLAEIQISGAAEGHYQVGELRRLRGDLAGAEAAYREAHRLGRDPQPGLALLWLAQGRAPAAAASVRAALAAVVYDRLARAWLCAAQVEIALAAGQPEVAARACEELERTASTYGSSGLESAALQARGAVLLAGGRAEAALPTLRAACRRWQELDAPYDAARVRVALAGAYRALDDGDAAALELDAAEAVFERLGAAPDAARVHALRGRPALPGGLTDREAEVLALVAAGRSNREIAEALVLSSKTVARHLSNIFAKLGVASRTQAAAYAFEHGLATPSSG
jgi:DNA-binding NarL/FixJ family response regulator